MPTKIFLSAGHGATDPGAVVGIFTEAKLMAELRNLVAKRIKAASVPLLTDGTGDVNLTLREAIALARQCNGPRIELHLNAATPAARGVECLSAESQKSLAQKIAHAISTAMEIPKRGAGGWKPESASARGRLGFIRQARGVIVEVFFLTNPTELATYLKKKEQVADAIAEVLIAEAEK